MKYCCFTLIQTPVLCGASFSQEVSSESSYADLFSCFHPSRCNVPGFNLHPGKGSRLCNKNKPSTWSTNSLSQFHSLGVHQVATISQQPRTRRIGYLRLHVSVSSLSTKILSDPFGSHQTRGWSPGWASVRQGNVFLPHRASPCLNAWLLDHLGSKQF